MSDRHVIEANVLVIRDRGECQLCHRERLISRVYVTSTSFEICSDCADRVGRIARGTEPVVSEQPRT